MKNPGAVLEPGSIVAKLELDDPSKVTQVRMVIAFIYFYNIVFTQVANNHAVIKWN